MYIPDEPRFSPFSLRTTPPARPAWLGDESWVPAGNRGLYARSSLGLYAALGQHDGGDDRTALLPAYVPHAVVWPLLDRGYDLQYYPVTSDLTLPADRVAARIDATEPDVALFVDYFGFRDDALPTLVAQAREMGATVVEDCARGIFARDTTGELLGSAGDIAIYSLYKTLPVPDGGLVVSDLEVPEPTERASNWEKALSSVLEGILHRVGVPPSRLTGTPKPDRSEVEVYTGDVAPPSERSPLRGPCYVTACGLADCEPARIQANRRDAYRDLRRALVDCDAVDVLTPPAHDGASPFGVAVRLPDRQWRDTCYQALSRAGYPVVVYQWPPCSSRATLDGAQQLRNTTCVVPTYRRLVQPAIRRLVEMIARAPDHV